ncbi:MAG TPA: hypothetical protein PLL10_05765, partial [Elusimicrobiales bacterium]|nr:hypothetical protein [Elusimicrobiales bacterium]
MSWLEKKISNVLNKQTPESIDSALSAMMREVLDEYERRLVKKKLRVTDDSDEGILFGERDNT